MDVRKFKTTGSGVICLGCHQPMVSELSLATHQECIPERQLQLIKEIRDNLLDHLQTNLETEYQYRWGLDVEPELNTANGADHAIARALEDWVRARLQDDWKKVSGADRLLSPWAWPDGGRTDE